MKDNIITSTILLSNICENICMKSKTKWFMYNELRSLIELSL